MIILFFFKICGLIVFFWINWVLEFIILVMFVDRLIKRLLILMFI